VKGYDAVLTSTIPMGGGVSSSSAVTVASATAFKHVNQPPLTSDEFTMLTGECEWEYSGVRGGIMDQFTSLHAQEGHALLLDCKTLEAKQIPFPTEKAAILVVNTNVAHELINSPYNQRRLSCEAAAKAMGRSKLRDATFADLTAIQSKVDRETYNRALHVIGEDTRTLNAAELLAAGEMVEVGSLVNQSHDSLRDLYEVSCPELDAVVDAARSYSGPGVYGARMMGGGFGGCAIVLVEPSQADAVTKHLRETFAAPFPAAVASGRGAPTILRSKPGPGARVETLVSPSA
jgi:galactokinase